MSYEIAFAESVKQQLKDLSARERAIVIDAIAQQLVYEPLVETRNRKKLRPNRIAPWELRIGYLRVFYEVVEDEPNIVHILAVGYKEGNTFIIGGREVDLNEKN
ncbi:MAG: type II toxin-antitoxin system RelE/ParE family toxin [Cyanobacteria bacterium P01_E01_bin.42]